MRILILASNPRKDLNLEEEIRDLQGTIERSRNREDLDVEVGFAVRPEDLQGLLLKHEPEIVHFCGHGTGKQGLVLQESNRIQKLVSTDALSNLFELCSGWVRCVVLNACYSEVQANAIVEHIDYAIGMNHEIRDDAAIAFATGFYQALGYGQSIEQSYKFGCNAIQLQISDNSNFRSVLPEEKRKLQVASTVEKVDIPEYLKPVLKIKPNLSTKNNSTLDTNENLLPSQKLDIQSYIAEALEREIAIRQNRGEFSQFATDNATTLDTPNHKSVKTMNPLTITNLLAPCLPFLIEKVGKPALEGAASKIGEDTWTKAKAVWTKLSPKVRSNAAANIATEKLAQKPDSQTWQAALTEELESILEQDPTLASAIAEILEEEAENIGTTNNIQQTVHENKGQVIGQMNNSEAKNIGKIGNVGGDLNL